MSVFHVAYRPASLKELDLPEVRQKIESILKADKSIQSMLFCGPKGSGKTSAARIVAGMINGVDTAVVAKSMDVMEIDGASYRGIDDVRALREKIFLLPAELKRKVFIVDEVHMLTKEAFNALLKILEEPPEHVFFILCTTDPEDLPETIMSRLVRVDFRRAKMEEVKTALERIVEKENLKLEKGVEEVIFEKSEGSFRNAVKMLNEMVLEMGKNLELKKVEEWVNKSVGGYSFEELEKDLVKVGPREIILKIDKAAQMGIDMAKYTQDLVAFEQARLLGKSELGTRLPEWMQLLLVACKQLRDSPVGQLPLQLAVLEFLKDSGSVDQNTSKSGKQNINKVDKLTSDLTKGGQAVAQDKSVGAAVLAQIVTQVNDDISNQVDSLTSEPVDQDKSKKIIGVDLDKVCEQWPQVLSSVKSESITLEAFLRASKAKALEEDMLVLEVFYPFHKDRIEEPKNRLIFEHCLSQVMGCGLRVRLEIGNRPERVVQVQAPVMTEAPVVQMAAPTAKDELYEVAREIFS